MFGLGTWEILLILIAALVFIGPSKLPALASTMGKGMRDLKRAMAGFEDDVRKATDVSDNVAPEESPADAEAADTEAVDREDTDESDAEDRDRSAEHDVAPHEPPDSAEPPGSPDPTVPTPEPSTTASGAEVEDADSKTT